jgi:hypothetical protein
MHFAEQEINNNLQPKPQNTRRLVAHLKSICSKRRESWKKSTKEKLKNLEN